MRVNARVDEATQMQLNYLTEATGQTVSDVVREALAVYHAKVREQQPRPKSKYLALAGTGRSGHTDTASNVKKYVAEAIEAKMARGAHRSGKSQPQVAVASRSHKVTALE